MKQVLCNVTIQMLFFPWNELSFFLFYEKVYRQKLFKESSLNLKSCKDQDVV